MIEPHYTIEEAATLLRKKPKTVSNMISARKITVVSTRPALIPESAIKAYLAKRTKRAVI